MRDRPPLWVSASASVIRRLPFGRYQLANALARFAGAPFLAYLPADLGGCELCLRSSRHDLARSVLHRPVRAAGDAARSAAPRSRHGRRRRRRQLGLFHARRARISSVVVARVIALEPHPRLAAMLAATMSATTGLAHVEIVRAAAAAGTGSRPFVGFDERGGNWGVSRAAREAEVPDFESRP